MSDSYNADVHSASWAWRATTKTTADQAPLTPPMSSSFHSRRPATANPNPTVPSARVALPPIAQFDRQLSAMQPLTPPDDEGLVASSSTLPPINDDIYSKRQYSPAVSSYMESQQQPQHPSASVWDSSPQTIDWLDFTRNRSAHFIAEKTCEMICYLWFASSPVEKRGQKGPSGSLSIESTLVSGRIKRHSEGDAVNAYPSPNHSPSSPARPTAHPSPSLSKRSPPSHLQLVATASFVTFMQKLLETTQVSQSVIVLSLHYIHRLKERNLFTPAQRGSEFRIAVAGLMMANKFLDDNTYTNKTWSEVSGIDLEEINMMEREFLMGVDFNLYVDKPTYESWLNLLKGLVIAKEKDAARSRADLHRRRDARKVTTNARSKVAEYQRQSSHRVPSPTRSYIPQSHYQDPTPRQQATQAGVYCTPSRLPSLSKAIPPPYYPRVRSTSPTQGGSYEAKSSTFDSHMETFDNYVPSASSQAYRQQAPALVPPASHLRVNTAQPNYSLSNKRTAEDAFSPTSASFSHLPNKRPSSITLQIPDSSFGTGMSGSVSGAHSYSPLESLSSFATMSLANGGDPSPERNQSRRHSQHLQPLPPPSHHGAMVPSTLVAPYSYSVENQRHRSQPQELYFYTLASSPMDGPTRSRSRRERRQASEDIDMHADGADQTMSDEEDEEQEINGQRLRTRKGKLMRCYREAEAQPSSSYAYDYSTAHGAYRQQPSSGYGYATQSTTTSKPAQPDYSPTYGSSQLVVQNNTLPPLAHPVPRSHIGVVQSASTSPSGIYLRDLGYPGSAYPVRSNPDSRQYQQPTSQSHSNSSNSWYPVSYHPSPVQPKAEVQMPSYHDSQEPRTIYSSGTRTTNNGSSTALPALPHYHDNIWAKPPAVVSLAVHRQDEYSEDDRSDGSSDGYMDGEVCSYQETVSTAPTTYHNSASSSIPSSKPVSQDAYVPTAPFANAGPAGVHVSFGDSYGQGHSNYSYGYPVGYPSSYGQQHRYQPGPPPTAQHSAQRQSYCTDEWNRGRREY